MFECKLIAAEAIDHPAAEAEFSRTRSFATLNLIPVDKNYNLYFYSDIYPVFEPKYFYTHLQ